MKILVVNPFGIGDVLFTTPLIRALKDNGHTIFYWCNERVEPILKYNKAVEGIFSLSRGDFKKAFRASPLKAAKRLAGLIKRIRRERFGMALDFSLDYRYSLLLRLLGVKRLIGFDYKGRGRFLTSKIKISGFNDKYIVEYYNTLLKFMDKGIEPRKRLELYIGDEERRWADEFLKSKNIHEDDTVIGILPGGGASWGESSFRKQWPKEKFAYVADELASKDRHKILVFGSEAEIPICEFISTRMKTAPLNLCGQIDLGQFAALLKRCRLLVTNDGGPLHMASALGVGTVSIFGPVDERVYGPYPPLAGHVTITGHADCRPCYRNFRYALCEKRACLDSIDSSAVLEAIRNSLKC